MKAQTTIETFTILAIISIVFLFVTSLFGIQALQIISEKNFLQGYKIASTLGPAINSVFLNGNGTTLFLSVSSYEANVTIEDRFLNVAIENEFYTWPLLTNNITNSTIPAGEIKIINTNGVISIEQL